MRKTVVSAAIWLPIVLILIAASGFLLSDSLAPRDDSAPSHTMPVVPGQTLIDQQLEPLLAQRPDNENGALMLAEGLDAFAARAMSARQAGRSLDVQYYIWRDDITGHLLLKELWDAAERGVRVRLLLDDISTGGKDLMLLTVNQHPGIEVRLYNALRHRDRIGRMLEKLQRAWRVNHRMHNKAWIADNRLAIVGGRNVGVEYFDAAPDTNFRDLDLMVFGPIVQQASDIFDAFWNSEAAVPIDNLNEENGEQLQQIIEHIQEEAQSEDARRYLKRVALSPGVLAHFSDEVEPYWSPNYRIISDPPLKHADSDRSQWLYRHITEDLSSATRSAHIISPYFVPDHNSMQELFSVLTASDARISIITNSLVANDVLAVHSGYMQYRKQMLNKGFELYEIRSSPSSSSSLFGSRGASLHTKAYMLDGSRGFIGSFNMDSRSINLNTEMGIAFDDPALYRALLEEYEQLASPKNSYQVQLNAQGQVRWHERSDPEVIYKTEPQSRWWQRAVVWGLSWLPIKSQL